MKHLGKIVAGGALLWACSVASARDLDRETCDSESAPPDQVEAACTRILAGGARLSNSDRAIFLNNRGNAYFKKAEYDKAISAYNEAIRLKPDLADAFNGRGTAY